MVDDDISSATGFESAMEATKSSIVLIFTSVFIAWTLDRITAYTISNVVYGLAISGGAGLIASGVDIVETNEQFVDTDSRQKHTDVRNAVSRVVGLVAFGFGFYLQLMALFVTEIDLSVWLPIIEVQYVNMLYWITIIVFLFISSFYQFVQILLWAGMVGVGLFVSFHSVKWAFGSQAAIITSLSIVVALQVGLLLAWFGRIVHRGGKKLLNLMRTPHEAENDV